MVRGPYMSLNAGDRSYLAILKKDIHRLAMQGGFEEKRLAEIDLIVSELGSNLVKHARQGEILAGLVETDETVTLELIAIDQGPGIADTDKMLRDGASTTHTLGHGLGSIRRLSNEFEIFSRKEWGTVLCSRIVRSKTKTKKNLRSVIQLSSLVVPKPGEQVSGDGCHSMTMPDGRIRLLVADGLGHGQDAHNAVHEAILAFKEYPGESPAEALRFLHQAIKKTRGMVATVVIADPKQKTWAICGVGNIATRLIGVHQSKSYMSYNGIVGHNIPGTMNDQVLSQTDYQQVILCSDGIRSRWEAAKLPPVPKYGLMMQASVIYKDFARKTDDMSVVIWRIEP